MKLKPIHPGEILREEFMAPYGLNSHKLAIALRVSAPTVYQIVNEVRPITIPVAFRLARFFSTTPEFWINLQTEFEIRKARNVEERQVNREIQPLAVAMA
jgi:antitoxin HigA-1